MRSGGGDRLHPGPPGLRSWFHLGSKGSGTGLLIEAGIAAGLLLGVVASFLMRVYFTYGSQHVFSRQLGLWLYASHITVDGLTAALIFFSVAMLLGRTGALALRARRASTSTTPAATVPVPVPAGLR